MRRLVALAFVGAALLAACARGPAPPIIDERGAGADEATAGEVEVFDGRVVGQDSSLGESVTAQDGTGRTVVPRLVVLTVDRTEGGGTAQVELVRDYVDERDATAVPDPLVLPDVLLRFTVRLREDGIYECWVAPCIQEAR